MGKYTCRSCGELLLVVDFFFLADSELDDSPSTRALLASGLLRRREGEGWPPKSPPNRRNLWAELLVGEMFLSTDAGVEGGRPKTTRGEGAGGSRGELAGGTGELHQNVGGESTSIGDSFPRSRSIDNIQISWDTTEDS